MESNWVTSEAESSQQGINRTKFPTYAANDVDDATSATGEPTDVLAALTAMFPNTPERRLRECASNNVSVESAVTTLQDENPYEYYTHFLL